jgi:hypothetical protein
LSVPVWVAVAIALGVVGAVAWQLLRAAAAARAASAWVPAAGVVPFAYQPVGVDEQRLVQAFNRAVAALDGVGEWRGRVAPALVGIRVYVSAQEAWDSVVCSNTACAEGKVAGATLDGMVVVNPSLTSLAHELAHVLEQRLDGTVDYSHASWPARGISAAVDNPQEASKG